MKKKDLGKKHLCYQCGCKFYDLKKPQPICPKCGVNQSEAPRRGASLQSRLASQAVAQRSKPRKRKEDDWEETDESFILENDVKTDALEDGLSLIEDDMFSENGEEDSSELE